MSDFGDLKLISSKEILDKTGISRATLNNYIKMGIIPRPIIRSPGEKVQGIKKLGYFSQTVLDRIRKVKILKKEGKTMDTIAKELGNGMRKHPAKNSAGSRLLSPDGIHDIPGKKTKTGLQRGKLKLTLEDLKSSAYLINYDFEISWINQAAERIFFDQTPGLTEEFESRNIFKLLFNWKFHYRVKNWKDIIAYHMSFAKMKYAKTWLKRLYKGISDEEVGILEKIYDDITASPNRVVQDTRIEFLRNDGSVENYHVYSLFITEGILIIYEHIQESA